MTSLSFESDFIVARLGVERARGLVREDDLRVLDERPRDGDALLLPARKLRGAALLVHFEVDTLQILLQKRLVRLLAL